MVSNTRLYGAAIAFASGAYSLWSASMAGEMVASSWIMGILGVVVIAHGTVLLTDLADRLGSASGPLMIAYSLVMLLNQALLAAGLLDGASDMGAGMGMTDGMGMNDGMEMAGDGMGAMGWDPGMVALALLMLVSGIIMTRGGTMMGAESGM